MAMLGMGHGFRFDEEDNYRSYGFACCENLFVLHIILM